MMRVVCSFCLVNFWVVVVMLDGQIYDRTRDDASSRNLALISLPDP